MSTLTSDTYCDAICSNTKSNRRAYKESKGCSKCVLGACTPCVFISDLFLCIPRTCEWVIVLNNLCPRTAYIGGKCCNDCLDGEPNNEDCRNCGPPGDDCLFCIWCCFPFAFISDLACCPCDCYKNVKNYSLYHMCLRNDSDGN